MILSGCILSPQRNKNLSAVEKVSGTRESIGMMSKRLLTIGGPREWEWMPDYGYNMIATMPTNFREFTFESIPTQSPVQTVTYNKMTLGDPETRARKEVYVISGMSFQEAESRLKNFLMKQFVNMEDVIDDD